MAETKQDLATDVSVDVLKWLYYENKQLLREEIEILQRDITEEFRYYLNDKIENRELINIAIRGEVSGSKSTSAMAIMDDVNKKIELKHRKNVDRYNHIFSDQTEFLRFIGKKEENVCIVIDEFSRIAETGLNSSTESVLFEHYSDVFAQKFVHRVSCSPSAILDRNANVILEYIGKDESKKISKFKLMYRNTAEGFQMITLGFIIVDVSKVLTYEWYRRYRIKKFKRMELIEKHGVRDIRDLEFADITLKVVDELKEIVADGNKGELTDLINAVVSKVCREEKRIYSILSTTEIASRVRNILSLYAITFKLSIKRNKLKTGLEIDMVQAKLNKVKEILNKEIDEENKRRQIYKEYLNIK